MVTRPNVEPRVFLSWSGERSSAVAQVFRDWLPRAMQNIRPYYNPDDTSKGSRWGDEIRSELERSDFGIIFLTPENLTSQWILFEAGALSKLGKSRVAPFLLDLKPTDVYGPLAQFQATQATRDDCFRLLGSLNQSLDENALEPTVLRDVFDHWWPVLDKKIKDAVASKPTAAGATPRSERELIEETLECVRRIEVRPTVGDDEPLIVYETAQTMWRSIECVLERIVMDLQHADDECSARCLSLVREIESAALGFAGQPYRRKGG